MITYTEVPNTITKSLLVYKSSGGTAAQCIPSIPITTGQSYILDNTASRINMTDYFTSLATLSGFNATTGVWTCPTTGYYQLYLRVVMTANNLCNSFADYEIGDFGRGSFIWSLRNNLNSIIYLYDDIVCYGTAGSTVSTIGIRAGVINYSNQLPRQLITAGTELIVSALNKTELGYIATAPGLNTFQSLTLRIDQLAT